MDTYGPAYGTVYGTLAPVVVVPDYSDVYPRVGRLLGSVGVSLQDVDLDDDIGLAIRTSLPATVLNGSTWRAYYAQMSGDDLDAFDQAIALLVSADLLPGLDLDSGLLASLQLGDQKLGFGGRSVSDSRGLADLWRRRAAVLLASLSFAYLVPKRGLPAISGVNGPSRARRAAWGCGE